MAYEANRGLFEITPFPFHHSAASVNVPPNMPNLSVPHLSNMPYSPLIADPMTIMKPVLPVVPNPPPIDRYTVTMPEELYKEMVCEPELAPCEEDMVTTCCHCGTKNYTWDLKWNKAKIKLKYMDEFMKVLKTQVQFNVIPSVSPAANQPTSIPSGMVCPPLPPDMYNLKSNLSATAQEFRPIQNQKPNVHVDETQNINKDAYICRVAISNDESQSRLPNEPLDTNDSGILESGIDSGVHDSGVSDSGVTDPTITDSAAERFVPNDDTDVANACNTCESDSLKNDKDGKKKAKKKRVKSQRLQKSNDGSMDNLVNDAVDEPEFMNPNPDVYYNQNVDVRPQQNDIKTLRSVKPPHTHKNHANDTDWSKPSTKNAWTARPATKRDEVDQRNGQVDRDHQNSYTDAKSQRTPKNTGHRRNDANSCESPMSGIPRDGRVSSANRRPSTNSNNNYNHSNKKLNKPYNSVVQEVEGNLFSASSDYSLAHCVAEDFRMSAGIAVTFKKDFNNVGELLDQRKTVGEVAVLEQGTRFIFYLITKQNSSGKPTMETVRQAIKSLRDECLKRGVEKLAMPRIGCGLDRLSWRNVKDALNEEFSSMDIELVVYNFREEEESVEVAPHSKKMPPPYPKGPLVFFRQKPLVQIEHSTALVVYGTQDGHMDKVCEVINAKHSFKDVYLENCSKRSLGDVIPIPVASPYDEYVFVLLAREKSSEPFSFRCLETCVKNLSVQLRKLSYIYVGFEFLEDQSDPMFNEKVLTLFRNNIHVRNIEIYACNAKNIDEHNAAYPSQNSNNDSPKFTQGYPRRS